MTDKDKIHLHNAFESLLRLDPKTTHDDLVDLYYNGINLFRIGEHLRIKMEGHESMSLQEFYDIDHSFATGLVKGWFTNLSELLKNYNV